ncbi:multiprotein-bridging factor 1 family protein [Kitasatospora sp. NPDC092948]|uniref:helix-turn-helix domain-containing protein n=1 Tax=Kitasatospora sp. NPDC092948 TaxID=3364088 RepID=UPI00381DBCF1
MTMWNPTAAALAAARVGDFGTVVREAREGQQLSQRGAARACGVAQSVLSRQIERRPNRAYPMDLLRAVAEFLEIPLHLVGLVDPDATEQRGHVQRRGLLAGTAALAASSVLRTASGGRRDAAPGLPSVEDGSPAAAFRLVTSTYRRLDATMPSRNLIASARSHLQLIEAAVASAPSDQQSLLRACQSETASFTGWLAWDMGDHGSARHAYGTAITAARSARHSLLLAYQLGSLAQMDAHLDNGASCLALAGRARSALTDNTPTVADAWLTATEALGHAALGDAEACDRSLVRSAALARTIHQESPPPWPWVFQFSETKIDTIRVTCGAWLGRSSWTLSHARAVQATTHTTQHGLLCMELALGHIAAGRIDTSLELAVRGLDIGLDLKSGRVIESARRVRRALPAGAAGSAAVTALDDRLAGAYF